jgi:hypothetical protein
MMKVKLVYGRRRSKSFNQNMEWNQNLFCSIMDLCFITRSLLELSTGRYQ